jgi:hypothetical protein
MEDNLRNIAGPDNEADSLSGGGGEESRPVSALCTSNP